MASNICMCVYELLLLMVGYFGISGRAVQRHIFVAAVCSFVCVRINTFLTAYAVKVSTA